MLIISRNVDDSVVITIPELDVSISVMVTSIRGEQVRLGFDTPRHWSIARGETLTDPEKRRLKLVPKPQP